MAVSLGENLMEVRKRLKRAARKAGRDISEITLITVTKTIEPRLIKKAIKEGLRVFGESYIQEAQEKIKKIGTKEKKWHFIGHLQKNKARFAVDLFDCIHSVDTPGLARELNKRASRTIDILIQVNISGEKTKHGATPDEAIEIARLMPSLKNLNFRGLMAIPPAVDPPERARPYFITLRRLAERINRERIPGVVVHDLSMGMSADFDIAIEEGATMVRVGTAIFGPREVEEKKPAPKAARKKTKSAKEPKKAAPTKKAAAKKTAAPPKKKPLSAKKTSKPAKKAATPKKTTTPAKKKALSAKKASKPAKKSPASGKKTTSAKKAATKKTGATALKKKAPATKPTKKATTKKTARAKATASTKKKAAPSPRAVTKKTAAKKSAPKKTGATTANKKTAKPAKKTTAADKKAAKPAKKPPAADKKASRKTPAAPATKKASAKKSKTNAARAKKTSSKK